MPAVQSQPHDLQTISIIAIFIAILCVMYWRVVLRVAAIVLVASAIYGFMLIMQGLHHATG